MNKINKYLKDHLASTLRWCATCSQTHCRRTLYLPSFDNYSFGLLLTILNGNLGSTGTHFSLADILSFCSFLMLDGSHVHSLMLDGSHVHSLLSKYILLEDYHTYSKVDWTLLRCDHLICIQCFRQRAKELKRMFHCPCGSRFPVSAYDYIVNFTATAHAKAERV